MRKGKAADAHDAGVVGLECGRARQLMLDAHEAGVVGLECVRTRQLMLMMFFWVVGLECARARQLMLMMLGLLGWNVPEQGS